MEDQSANLQNDILHKNAHRRSDDDNREHEWRSEKLTDHSAKNQMITRVAFNIKWHSVSDHVMD